MLLFLFLSLRAFDLPIRPSVAVLQWALRPAERNGQDQSRMAGIAQILFFFGNSEAIADLRKDKWNAPFDAPSASIGGAFATICNVFVRT